MKERPLEFGEVLQTRMICDERGDSRFFNPDRFTEVHKREVFKKVESNLGKCKDCPVVKIDVFEEEDSIEMKTIIGARAFCSETKKTMGACPAKEPGSGFLPLGKTWHDYEKITVDPKSGDWIAEAEKYAAKHPPKRTIISTPRGHGKSFVSEMAEKFRGASADIMFSDEVEEPKSVVESEDSLDEAVEFETNRSNYDNFGSW